MKKIVSYLFDYQKVYFDWKVYLPIMTFCVVAITLNYIFDFEDSYIDAFRGHLVRWLWMFLFHGIPFLVVCLILKWSRKATEWIRSPEFWIKFLIGFGLLALDRSFTGHEVFAKGFHRMEVSFVGRILSWYSSLLLVVLPLMILYPLLEKDRPRSWYGLAFKKFDARPYWVILAITMIFIGVGSFFSDLYTYYPRYARSGRIISWPKTETGRNG